MAYIKRIIDSSLAQKVQVQPAIAIEGAKAVGKTSSAKQFAATTIRLDDDSVREAVALAPDRVLKQQTPILLDEWQRLPQVWDYVRRSVDDDDSPGKFILTGSAYPHGAKIHSGAGRIITVRMRPFSLEERAMDRVAVRISDLINRAGVDDDFPLFTEVSSCDYLKEILLSGFPGIRKLALPDAIDRLDGYVLGISSREFAEQGVVIRNPQALHDWLRAYAAATASTASFETIRDGATPGQTDKPAKKTTTKFRDTLNSLWLIDQVDPWIPTSSPFKYIGKAPKHHLVDPALAARLLDVGEDGLMEDVSIQLLGPQKKPLMGRLFESLVSQSLQTYAQANRARLRHFRTVRGEREVDFIIERGNQIIAIEAKFATSISMDDCENLLWLEETFPSHTITKVIVYAGAVAYKNSADVLIVPAALLGA